MDLSRKKRKQLTSAANTICLLRLFFLPLIHPKVSISMSIRALALELYAAQRKVSELEKRLETASPTEEEVLRAELRVAQQELKMMRKMLDGEKENSNFRKRFK